MRWVHACVLRLGRGVAGGSLGRGKARVEWAGMAWAEKKKKARGELAERCWLSRGRRWLLGRGKALGRLVGRALYFFCFFCFYNKIGNTLWCLKKIGKMQIRYRWIRYEKSFNMRSNLEQKYKLYKTKI
jgi:hypothetical protein